MIQNCLHSEDFIYAGKRTKYQLIDSAKKSSKVFFIFLFLFNQFVFGKLIGFLKWLRRQVGNLLQPVDAVIPKPNEKKKLYHQNHRSDYRLYKGNIILSTMDTFI